MKTQEKASIAILALAHICVLHNSCTRVLAFTPGWTRISKAGNNGNNKSPPPPPRNNDKFSYFENDGDDSNNYNQMCSSSMLGLLFANDNDNDNNSNSETEDSLLLQKEDKLDDSSEDCKSISVRGGSQTTKSKSSTNNVIAGSKSSLILTQSYWSEVFQNLKKKAENMNPFKKPAKEDDEVDLTKVKIEAVDSNSEILPKSIVRSAAQRSGMVGSAMNSDRVRECARQLKKWYVQRGYVLHSVTGATLHSENGTATLAVEEPIVSSIPMAIKFTKEMFVDPETGEPVARRRYREKVEKQKGRALRNEEWVAIAREMNSTLIETDGRANPRKIGQRLGLLPGNHFQWDGNLWKTVAQSGIFAKVFAASPVRMNDGTVQLQVLCQEAPPRNLEYGVSKSLYTGHWEGELDFKHSNVLGSGESLGVIVRRGAKDPEASVTLRFSDDKFGMKGGYDAELFRDYIAVDEVANGGALKSDKIKVETSLESDSDDVKREVPIVLGTSGNEDSLLCRQGIKFNLRGPVSTEIVENSSASASIERTSTRMGVQETIGSTRLSLGPFVTNLPLGAKSSLVTSATTGARFGEKRLLPFSSGSITARQLFPLFTDGYSATGRQVKFGLQHTLMTATSHLPRHEANAAGFAARVRGYSGTSNGAIDSSVVGSAEVRMPITIPIQKDKVQQDASLVFFGDWMVGNRQNLETSRGGFSNDDMFGKSSVGIGLRKSVQGIPLKYDVSLTRDGKVGAFVSLGQDWEIY